MLCGYTGQREPERDSNRGAMYLSMKLRRLRFPLVVLLTLLGLFYYRFLNEEYELNNHMADDELPPITDTPAHDEVAAPQKLGLWEDIVEKNKYFPWLGVEKVETKQGSVLPDEYFNNQKAVDLRKHKKKYRYPVGKENYFKLPRVARDASYPSIQATEFSDGGVAMPARLARDKEAFMKSWKIYKDYGYGHDEVRPISHEVLDPFNGWSATLIDSIDTLHLMGEDEEVKEAIKFLQRVNFKQSYRNAIPIFENVIRVLGGMLTAYDITEDKSVLQNCEDLAHLLMEAFDTPNRMPLLHYEWQSELANRLASTSSSIAELGSLSLEFSKLSQLTGDNEYYDAITRITNALEKSKDNFLLPGLYSNHVDISGCKKLKEGESTKGSHLNKAKVLKVISDNSYSYCELEKDSIRSAEGLSQKYSLGGLGDSFYEYLPKMFHLLGGDAKYSQTYKEMYLRAAEHIRKYMLYRPKMVNNPDVLFVSSISVFQRSIDTIIVSPDEDMQHLTCFTGGMLALGSRLFNISEDMNLAEKVTLGCVKLYEELGIMPEVVKVDSMSNDEDYYDEDERINFLKKATETPSLQLSSSRYSPKLTPAENERLRQKIEAAVGLNKGGDVKDGKKESSNQQLSKRAFIDSAEQSTSSNKKVDATGSDGDVAYVSPRIELERAKDKDVFPIKQMEDGSYRWTGARENQPLWLNDARPFYNMRPEAIESVWYMYRTTGDSRWRDYGWMMWQNIERLCQRDGVFTEVDDLFSDVSNTHRFKDAVESFWFSETLKYFYLLFEESSVWSLDDYVFNTEAHPFKLQK